MTTISIPISGDVVKYTQFPVLKIPTNASDLKAEWFNDALVNNGYKDCTQKTQMNRIYYFTL